MGLEKLFSSASRSHNNNNNNNDDNDFVEQHVVVVDDDFEVITSSGTTIGTMMMEPTTNNNNILDDISQQQDNHNENGQNVQNVENGQNSSGGGGSSRSGRRRSSSSSASLRHSIQLIRNNLSGHYHFSGSHNHHVSGGGVFGGHENPFSAISVENPQLYNVRLTISLHTEKTMKNKAAKNSTTVNMAPTTTSSKIIGRRSRKQKLKCTLYPHLYESVQKQKLRSSNNGTSRFSGTFEQLIFSSDENNNHLTSDSSMTSIDLISSSLPTPLTSMPTPPLSASASPRTPLSSTMFSSSSPRREAELTSTTTMNSNSKKKLYHFEYVTRFRNSPFVAARFKKKNDNKDAVDSQQQQQEGTGGGGHHHHSLPMMMTMMMGGGGGAKEQWDNHSHINDDISHIFTCVPMRLKPMENQVFVMHPWQCSSSSSGSTTPTTKNSGSRGSSNPNTPRSIFNRQRRNSSSSASSGRPRSHSNGGSSSISSGNGVSGVDQGSIGGSDPVDLMIQSEEKTSQSPRRSRRSSLLLSSRFATLLSNAFKSKKLHNHLQESTNNDASGDQEPSDNNKNSPRVTGGDVDEECRSSDYGDGSLLPMSNRTVIEVKVEWHKKHEHQLIAHYTFDDLRRAHMRTFVPDLSTRENHALLCHLNTDRPVFVQGLSKNAMLFSGFNYLSCQYNPLRNMSEFTISFWFKYAKGHEDDDTVLLSCVKSIDEADEEIEGRKSFDLRRFSLTSALSAPLNNDSHYLNFLSSFSNHHNNNHLHDDPPIDKSVKRMSGDELFFNEMFYGSQTKNVLLNEEKSEHRKHSHHRFSLDGSQLKTGSLSSNIKVGFKIGTVTNMFTDSNGDSLILHRKKHQKKKYYDSVFSHVLSKTLNDRENMTPEHLESLLEYETKIQNQLQASEEYEDDVEFEHENSNETIKNTADFDRRDFFKKDDFNHLAIVYSGDRLLEYINGVCTDNKRATFGRLGDGGRLIIGAMTEGFEFSGFRGAIDELRIYNYPLNSGQIQELFTTRDSA